MQVMAVENALYVGFLFKIIDIFYRYMRPVEIAKVDIFTVFLKPLQNAVLVLMPI